MIMMKHQQTIIVPVTRKYAAFEVQQIRMAPTTVLALGKVFKSVMMQQRTQPPASTLQYTGRYLL